MALKFGTSSLKKAGTLDCIEGLSSLKSAKLDSSTED